MAEPVRSLRTDNYHVAWISAIRREFDIALAILDETFDTPPDLPEEDDENVYIFGRVRGHNVVMASLPEGRVGTEEAGRLATQITRSFKRLRFGLMVGIAGGAPSKHNDIRLGDVVVSVPNDSKRLGGVVNYFYGASIQEAGFQRRGSLNAPPTVLLSAVRALASMHGPVGVDVDQLVSHLVSKNAPVLDAYARPSSNSDVLFNATFLHTQPGEECADICHHAALQIIARDERLQKPIVTIHYGIVGSASNLMRDAILRDKIAQEDGALCFEMESAGLMNNKIGWLVVRGISDYSDTHKNDRWQNYAAAVAATYSRELLGVVQPRKALADQPGANPAPGTRKQGQGLRDILPKYANTL